MKNYKFKCTNKKCNYIGNIDVIKEKNVNEIYCPQCGLHTLEKPKGTKPEVFFL